MFVGIHRYFKYKVKFAFNGKIIFKTITGGRLLSLIKHQFCKINLCSFSVCLSRFSFTYINPDTFEYFDEEFLILEEIK